MDFACDRCRRSYFIPDELVLGRERIRAKCTECGHAFEVKVGAAADVPEAAPGQATAPGPAPATSPAGGAPPGRAARPSARPPHPPAAGHGETTGEIAIAAYERAAAAHRRRNLVLGLGGVAALAAAAIAAVTLLPGRKAPEPAARVAAADDGPAGPAPYADASGLLRRPGVPSPASPVPAPTAPVERKPRPRIGRDDRKLLDLLARKDDVTVVAPEGDSVDSAQAALDPSAVEKTVAANRKGFDACISKAMRLNPNLRVARRATLVVTVQPSGSVAGAFIAEEEVDRTDLGACLCATARRMVFPAFDGEEPLDISMPLSLAAVF